MPNSTDYILQFNSMVALGILQLLSILFFGNVSKQKLRYLRTPSKSLPSEATVAYWLRKNIFLLLAKAPELGISKIIHSKMADMEEELKYMNAS